MGPSSTSMLSVAPNLLWSLMGSSDPFEGLVEERDVFALPLFCCLLLAGLACLDAEEDEGAAGIFGG